MQNFKGRSINELAFKAIDHLVTEGENTSSRNGDISCDYLNVLELSNPRSRHLNLLGRKSNIFAMIAETFWVMAGDDKIDPYLSFFLPRAKDFSDDGKTWRGAYGPRLHMYNQLEEAVNTFRDEGINSRRALVSIYMPEMDSKESLEKRLGHSGPYRDIPCNNMLHFYITPDKKLNILVTQRSGDVIWGALSINVTEFTFLQEHILQEVKRVVDPSIEMGTYQHQIVNMHLYDFTASQGYEVLENKYSQKLTRQNHTPLQFPRGVHNTKDFFADILRVCSGFIESDCIDYNEIKAGLFTTCDLHDVHQDGNLLHKYIELVGAYICAKNLQLPKGVKTKDIVIDLKGFDKEFTSSIEASVFRKFLVTTDENPEGH